MSTCATHTGFCNTDAPPVPARCWRRALYSPTCFSATLPQCTRGFASFENARCTYHLAPEGRQRTTLVTTNNPTKLQRFFQMYGPRSDSSLSAAEA